MKKGSLNVHDFKEYESWSYDLGSYPHFVVVCDM